jgi:endonuclease/exonuclease/phosphatase family metal-dependent hydrolase
MAIVDRRIAIGLASTVATGFALSRFLNYHPRPVQQEECRSNKAATLALGQSIKVVTYNAQFFAGTNYHFFYDGGRDTLVDPADVRKMVAEISAFLMRENPDFVLLQEVDCGARRTGYLDEIELLINSFPKELCNHVATFYWKSRFVPHPKVMGPAGTKLAIFSRYRLLRATRYQLPRTPGNPIVNDFNFKRALLEVEVPFTNGGTFCLLNTHLEAFPKGTNVMKRQVDYLLMRLESLDRKEIPWVIGGDFNLLPPGQWAHLTPEERGCHRESSETSLIYERYRGVPTISDASGQRMRDFLTFTKQINGERVPIRTLDYFFAGPTVTIEKYAVRQNGVKHLSDHLPLVAQFTMPKIAFD